MVSVWNPADEEQDFIFTFNYAGSAKIHGPKGDVQEILVAIDTGTYNVRKATCSYYCIWRDGYYIARLIGTPFGVGSLSYCRVLF